MKKAKNTITTRAAFIAGLVMLLCYVASAGPTYSFVKITGEWSFYEESGVLNSTFEVSPANPGRSGRLTANSITDADSEMSLPAVSSLVKLSSKGDSSGNAAGMLPDGSANSGVGGVDSRKASANSGADDAISVTADAYPRTSSYLLQSTMKNGFSNPKPDGWTLNGGLRNNTSDTTDAWEYWNNTDNQDIASPVPVPVPGSIILAAIGAGLVKLLHDRRLKR